MQKRMNGSTPPIMTAATECSNESVLVNFRAPEPSDGLAIWQLAKEADGLDANSPYSYLISCRDFSRTSTVLVCDGALIGFINAYLRPASYETLFVWQIVVERAYRRRGFALEALHNLLVRLARDTVVRYVEATVTPGNLPSHRLFRSFAKALGVSLTVEPLFAHDFDGQGHPKEDLYRIGPIQLRGITGASNYGELETTRDEHL